MSKILVLPDIHGRQFWKEPCGDISEYDKVVFLGDYLDPYRFEYIKEQDAIENFRDIIDFKKANSDKVVMLLGNHDLPYYSQEYLSFSPRHSRYSWMYHEEMERLFAENHDFFVFAFCMDEILFSHSGVIADWYVKELEGNPDDSVETICQKLNGLKQRLRKLFIVSNHRGGWNPYSSCVWSDVHEMMEQEEKTVSKTDPSPLETMRQVFGHTQQVEFDEDDERCFGEPVIGKFFKMLDNGHAYSLDTDSFTTSVV